MTSDQEYEADSLDRVQAFMVANAATLGAITSSAAAVRLNAAVAQVSALRNDQGTANLVMLGQLTREKALAKELRNRYLKPFAMFARALVRELPDIAALTAGQHHLRGRELATAGRTLAASARDHMDALTRGGFTADVVDQMAATADALDAAISERANTKVARVGATGGIKAELASGRAAVRMLDAVITQQFAENWSLLASWRGARRVVRKPGGPGAPPAPGDPPAPPIDPAAS